MFIPLFIAILLGLVNPSTHNQKNSASATTVILNNSNTGNPETGDPDSDGDDTGGEHGHMPPPKKN